MRWPARASASPSTGTCPSRKPPRSGASRSPAPPPARSSCFRRAERSGPDDGGASPRGLRRQPGRNSAGAPGSLRCSGRWEPPLLHRPGTAPRGSRRGPAPPGVPRDHREGPPVPSGLSVRGPGDESAPPPFAEYAVTPEELRRRVGESSERWPARASASPSTGNCPSQKPPRPGSSRSPARPAATVLFLPRPDRSPAETGRRTTARRLVRSAASRPSSAQKA